MTALVLCAMMALQDDVAANAALDTFGKAWIKEKTSDGKTTLVTELAKTQHAKVVAKLLSLLSDADKTVRIGAAAGLATFTSTPELKKAASSALCSGIHAGANLNDADVKIAILTALGTLGEETSASKVKEFFDDKDNKIAVAAVTASGTIKSKVLMDPLIQLLRECEAEQKKSQPPPPAAGGGKAPKVMPTKARPGSSNAPDPEQAKKDRANALIGPTQSALCLLSGQGSLKTSDQFDTWWSKNRAALK
jgi:hypothetical protein